MNRWVNQWMGAEIYFVHIGHGVLFWIVIAIVALNVPWWGALIGLPIVVFSILGWAAEAKIVLPVANRLLKGEGGEALARGAARPMRDVPRPYATDGAEGMTDTATTRPRGEDAMRRDEPSTQD